LQYQSLDIAIDRKQKGNYWSLN